MVSSSVRLEQAVGRFESGDLTRPPEPVKQAWSNDVFRVSTETGVFAIKLYPPNLPSCKRTELISGTNFERSAGRPLRADPIRLAGRDLGVLHAMRRPGGYTSQLRRLRSWVER